MTAAGPRPLFGFLPWLLASLALHASVLMQWPQAGAPMETAADTAGATLLHMRLVQNAAPAQAVAAQSARAAAVERRPVTTTRTIVAAAHTAPPATQPRKAPERTATTTTEMLQTAATTNAAINTTRATSATTATTGSSNASAAAPGWPELMSLLHAAIDRHKRYPQSALSMSREGSARVDFRLGPDGHIDDLNIGVSSGVRALDLAAYRAVQAIAPFTEADRYLDRTQRFQVDVVFRIN